MADVIVYASHREPFGRVVVEAMSLGKPVMATILGGPAEFIEDGVRGLLAPWNEVAALSQAIEKFLLNRDFAARGH